MRTKREEGQSMVEFALMFIPLMLIVWGVVDVAPIYPIRAATREAASFGAQEAAVWSPASGLTCEEWVEAAVSSRTADLPNVSVSVDGCSGMNPTEKGTVIKVTVSTVYQFPFYGTFLNPPVPRTLTIENSSLRMK